MTMAPQIVTPGIVPRVTIVRLSGPRLRARRLARERVLHHDFLGRYRNRRSGRSREGVRDRHVDVLVRHDVDAVRV